MRAKKDVRRLLSFVFAAVLITAAVLLAIGYFGGAYEPDVGAGGETSSSVKADEIGLTVSFIDVGQGDCILAVCGGEALLIDAGDNGTEQDVINYIRKSGISRLDYVVVTHQHADHIGGMAEVLNEFEADIIIMPRLSEQLTPTNSTYSSFLKAAEKSSAKKLYAKVGMTYNLGEAVFTVIAPVKPDAEDLNDMSVVIRLDYGENSFLFTGDASQTEENDILASGADIDCDVLKVGHHGSSTSSKNDFLAAVTPQAAVIMCGEDNRYNHPSEKTLKRLLKHTPTIYRTDICGSVVAKCSKTSCEFEY